MLEIHFGYLKTQQKEKIYNFLMMLNEPNVFVFYMM